MEFKYVLKYGNYKRMTIKISRSGLIAVSAPQSYSKELVAKIITEKKGWIIKHLLEIEKTSEKNLAPPPGYILYMGDIYRFRRVTCLGKVYFINEAEKTISSGTDLEKKENLLKFYLERANFVLKGKIVGTAKKYGFEITKAQVRNTKKRWGSCTSAKVITLSSRLIMAPDFVTEAIILHELTHTKIMNHSKNFYAELKKLCPFYEEADIWLKEKMPPEFPPEKAKEI